MARSIGDYFAGGGLRLGVTGLSRSGKTVFLTALVSNLIAGVRLPVLAASAEGRITRARLEPQPDDAVPRFAYEDHMASLAGPDRMWPQSTRRIAQLRLTIEFESAARWNGRNGRLALDLVDYPGEWLLDLPLIDKSYARLGARDARRQRDPRPLAALGRLARPRSPASTRTPKPTRTAPATSPSASPPICARRARTSMRSRPCRPAVS